ncbi:MAG: response regulator [Desulfobacteraceae bacterium]
MAEKSKHTVLIVDDDPAVGRSLGRVLKNAGIDYIHAESGEDALELMEKAAESFAVVISDQQMPGMKGTALLEKAKQISPDTVRFLFTGYSDVDALSEAVNKGSIQRYISKPWDNKVLLEAIKSGVDQYELLQENNRLFRLAKEQKKKLYKINCDLKESAARHKQTLVDLDRRIAELNREISRGAGERDYTAEIEALLQNKKMLTQEKMNFLYAAIVGELFEQFQDIAARNGFEMPRELLTSNGGNGGQNSTGP